MKNKIKQIDYKKYLNILYKSVFAGMMIAIGGTIYLALENKIVGALLFSIGLLTICMYKMNLFTGKIGYVLINKPSYLIELLITLIGNFIGTRLVAELILNTRYKTLSLSAQIISNIKITDTFLSIFILSIFCGVLMYIAVNNYNKSTNNFAKYIGIFMCVMVFILCGFEHCVANMFYFSLAKIWTVKSLEYMLVMVSGNTLGAILIALYYNNFFKN